jgi:hypothetical protein
MVVPTRLLGCLVFTVSVGTAFAGSQAQTGGAKKQPPALRAEEARAALLELTTERFTDVENEANDLKKAEVERNDDGTVTIGRWTCDLRKQQFFGTFGDRKAGAYWDYGGEFRRTKTGKWKAYINYQANGKSS